MFGAALIAGLLLASPSCNGDAVRLDWVRSPSAEGCPDGATVADQVCAELGCDPFGAPPRQRFEVLVEAKGAGWQASLRRIDAEGTIVGETALTTRAEDCAVLAEAVALAVAIAAGPRDSARPPPVKTSTAVLERKIIVVPTPAPPPTPPPAPPISLALGPALDFGTFPEIAPGASIILRGRLTNALGIGADLLLLPTRRQGDFGFGLVAASVSVCPRLGLGSVTVGGCARGYVGSITTVLYPGSEPIDPGPFLWGAVSASGFGELGLGTRGFVRAELEALLATPRRAYLAEDGQTIHREAPVALLSRISFGVHFGR